MSNSGAYRHHANATTRAHTKISIFSVSPLNMEGGAGAPGACYVGEHVVVRALGGYGPLFVVAEFCLYLGLGQRLGQRLGIGFWGSSGEYINKNKLAGVQRTAGMWWFLQTCTRFCMKCFESTCGFVYPVRET